MSPFPRPPHRTGRADFPHPALGQGARSAAHGFPSPRFVRLPGFSTIAGLSGALHQYPSRLPFQRCLEPRPLPSPGITRIHRYYGPLRLPRRPGIHAASPVAFIPRGRPAAVPRRRRFGSPVLRASPGVHAVTRTPADSRKSVALTPCSGPGRAGLPRRRPSLNFEQVGVRVVRFRGLLGVHSRYGLHARVITS